MSPTPLGVTLASTMGLHPSYGTEIADRAAELGYDSLWVAETTGPEAFATLGRLGTRVPTMGLGTGVLAAQLRTPALAVMGAATLQVQRPETAIHLGVGVSSPVVAQQWHGAEYSARPLSQMREYLTLCREILTGEPVTFTGDHYSCRKFRLGLRLDERRPRLVLGALNARMLQLAGELADGVLLNYLPPSAVPWCVEQVRRGERDGGRPDGSCEILAYVHAGVTSLDAGRPAARRDLFSYAVVDSYARAFSRAGFDDEVAAIRAAHADRDRDAAVAAVSDDMIQQIDHCGDAQSVGRFVRDYVDAGVDRPVLMPLPWGEDRRRVIADTMDAAIAAVA